MKKKWKKAIDVFWRIYCWASIISWIAITGQMVTGPNSMLNDANIYFKLLGAMLYLIATTGLFAYSYDKKVLNKVFWKIFLSFLLFWEFYANVFMMPPSEQGITMLAWSLGALFITPLYIALYLYGFKSK